MAEKRRLSCRQKRMAVLTRKNQLSRFLGGNPLVKAGGCAARTQGLRRYFVKFFKKMGKSAHGRHILWYNLGMELLGARRFCRLRRLRVLAALALATAIVFLLADIPAVANAVFVGGITRGLTWLIGRITNFIPLSLYEITALLLIAVGLACAVFLIVDLCRKRFGAALSLLYRLGVALLSVLLAFGLLYAPLYARAPAASAFGLQITQADAASLYAAAEYYVDELNSLSDEVERDGQGNAVCPYTFSELADLLNAAFDGVPGDYFAFYEVRPKAVALSVPMSYLGITGIYFPFYAEANVNVNIPDCDLPVTMAHEMAHAKGVAVESEANITAYVLCICSEDVFLRYSGLMEGAARLLNELPEAQFETLYDRLCEEVRQEYRNVSAHYAKYEGLLDRISTFFNDLFLKSNGIPSGTRNYSETAASLVALYQKITAEG